MQLALQPRSTVPALRQASVVQDREFIALLDAYRSTGGLLRGAMLADQYGQGNRENYLWLARKIASREMLSFRWNESVWLPMFQFTGNSLEIRSMVRDVLNELVGVMEGWDIAHWFIEPNLWLGGASPLSLIDANSTDVRDAARADRFVIKG